MLHDLDLGVRMKFDKRQEESYREGLDRLKNEGSEEELLGYLRDNLEVAQQQIKRLDNLIVPGFMAAAVTACSEGPVSPLEAKQDIRTEVYEEEAQEAYESALNATKLAEHLRYNILKDDEDLDFDLDYYDIDKLLGEAIEAADTIRDQYGEFIDEDFEGREYT